MSSSSDVIRGSLKLDSFQEGKTYSSLDDFVKALANMYSVELPSEISNVIVSSTEPGDDFKEGVWIRRNTAGNFVGMYVFQSGEWTKIFPEAVSIGESSPLGVDSGLWVEVDVDGNFVSLKAYDSGWVQLYPDPNPPDYAAIFAAYYRSTVWGGVSASAGNNYFITTAPYIDSLAVPTVISFIPDADNTGATTLDVNSLGAVAVIDSSGSPLSGGEFQADVIAEVTFDGTNFIVSLPAELNGAYIIDGTIATAKLVDGAVTTDKIATAAVTAGQIATSAVSQTRIANLAVSTGKIQDNAITAPKIAANAVIEAKILDGAVTESKIGPLAAVEAKIGVGAVTETKLGPQAVTTAKIADLNVTTGKLANGAVTGAKISHNSVDSEHYVDLSIDTAHIGNDQVTNAKIADDAVQTAQILDLNVTTNKIAANAVTTSKILDLNVTTGKINNNAVTAGKISATAAGSGLKGGGGTPLYVNTDNSTLEISSDTVRIKADGVKSSHIGSLTDYLTFSTTYMWTKTTSRGIITADGVNQGGAEPCAYSLNIVNGANNSNGVILPTAVQGRNVMVINNHSSNSMYVYPAVGDSINCNTSNQPISMQPRTGAMFHAFDSDYWCCVNTGV